MGKGGNEGMQQVQRRAIEPKDCLSILNMPDKFKEKSAVGGLVEWWEHLLVRLGRTLEDVIGDSRRRVERRQTKTHDEILAEREAELEDAVRETGNSKNDGFLVEDEEEEGPIYNPLNLPLDWDGKPIPYWLYRLHGLNMNFKCEICGGETYRGRRDFDRHFQENKHSYGMKLLGIPNTKHFHDITKVEVAKARKSPYFFFICAPCL